MKLFEIESKFIAEDQYLVFEHRRLVTPLFFIRLKPRRYEYLKGQMVTWWIIAANVSGWFIGNRYITKSDPLTYRLESAICELKQYNVVRLKK